MAPFSKIPKEAENFWIIQRGDKIILNWTNPAAYSDGSPLSEIKEVEIWLVEEPGDSIEVREVSAEGKKQTLPDFPLGEFKVKARLEDVIKKEKFPEYQEKQDKDSLEFEYVFELSEEKLTLKRLIFALVVKDSKGKDSEFSNLLSIEPKIVPLPPQEIQSAIYEDRIEVSWKEPEKNIDNSTPAKVKGYNIYRKEEEEFSRQLNSSLLKEKKYSDANFTFGQVYFYFIRASATEESPFWESSDSEIIEVLAKDSFPPEAPSGLVSMTGENFIAMSWDANQEEDLYGYRVWRREESQKDYVLLTPQPIRENVYNDSTVEKNKRYYYAITAQDRSKNESNKSKPISEIIKDIS